VAGRGHLGIVVEHHQVLLVEPRLNLADPVDVHDRRAADPHELVGIQMPLDPGEGLPLLVHVLAGVDAHQLVRGLDPVDGLGPQEEGAVRVPDQEPRAPLPFGVVLVEQGQEPLLGDAAPILQQEGPRVGARSRSRPTGLSR
jgi:hypothetical protein